eukprot:scaffold2455_cov212-Chaetoceros_neogracile.AAC.14
MTDPITKAVKAMTLVYGSTRNSMDSFASAASNPKQFPKVVLAVTVASGLVGFVLMQIVDQKRERNMQSFVPSQETKKSMTQNESVVRAMIENAKASTPTENLENAAMAQQNFMLFQFDKSVAEDKRDQSFLQRIAKRSDEIRNNEKDLND